MPSLTIVILTTFLCYIMQYIFCFVVDKREIEKHEKKIKLNKYTKKLFFLWNRNEKLYWLVYIIIISESILFIVIWVLYFLGDINIFRKFLNIYVGICSIFDTILAIKILIKRVKDYITSKNR
nr:hypothetical protein [uncultured Lachnoanaerobaculum sp.]